MVAVQTGTVRYRRPDGDRTVYAQFDAACRFYSAETGTELALVAPDAQERNQVFQNGFYLGREIKDAGLLRRESLTGDLAHCFGVSEGEWLKTLALRAVCLDADTSKLIVADLEKENASRVYALYWALSGDSPA